MKDERCVGSGWSDNFYRVSGTSHAAVEYEVSQSRDFNSTVLRQHRDADV